MTHEDCSRTANCRRNSRDSGISGILRGN